MYVVRASSMTSNEKNACQIESILSIILCQVVHCFCNFVCRNNNNNNDSLRHLFPLDFLWLYILLLSICVSFECIMGMMTIITCANSFQSSRSIVIFFLINHYSITLCMFTFISFTLSLGRVAAL